MRDGADSQILAGATRRNPRLSSWKSSTLLHGDVPITSGTITADAGQQVPERLTFTVPAYADRRSWVPDGPDHPLASCGQIIDVDITVTSSLTQTDSTTRMGRYRIQSWDHDDTAGAVRVDAVGLLQVVAGDRFLTPQAPRPGGTFVSEATRLLSEGLGIVVDDALVNRGVPQSFQWDEDRLQALYDIADAWPARLRVDQYGTVRFLAPLPEIPVPVLRFSDGRRGTLVSAPREGTRDGIHNIVVVRSSDTDSPASAPVQATAQVSAGPLRPDLYGPEVKFFSSPLLTTKVQLAKAAATILADATRQAVVQQIRAVPDPRVDLDDAVEVVRNGQSCTGWVVAYSMPLTIEGGPMSVDVGLT